ncbi:MAG TPA: hypothetical protein VK864_11830, partial [Longimicrobiales bacterium]|nr:hypothetical protein [Longimicrobiales bacterium]
MLPPLSPKRRGRIAPLAALLALIGADRTAAQTYARVESGPFIVLYSGSAQRLANRVAVLAAQNPAMPGIPDSLWRTQPITIVLAPSNEAFQRAAGGRVPEWGAGVTVPEQSRIVLPAYVSVGRGGPLDYGTVLRHELAHIALHRAVSPAPVPRWFDEGYCSWAARELDLEAAWLLRLAFVTGRAPPLDSLELSWPTGGSRARLAYLLSASVMDFLVAESGTYALERLIERWRAGGNFETALGA